MTLLLLFALAADPKLTPGALCSLASSDFSAAVGSPPFAVCRRHVSSYRKRVVLKRYGVSLTDRSKYEVDHRIPLCMGGSNVVENLFPQPLTEATKKDSLEKRLCSDLRARRTTQAAAVKKMLEWRP